MQTVDSSYLSAEFVNSITGEECPQENDIMCLQPSIPKPDLVVLFLARKVCFTNTKVHGCGVKLYNVIWLFLSAFE